MNWSSRIAEAFQVSFDAISVDSALTRVDSGHVISGPNVLRFSVPVVPPGISDVTEFKWGIVTVVLERKTNKKKFIKCISV